MCLESKEQRLMHFCSTSREQVVKSWYPHQYSAKNSITLEWAYMNSFSTFLTRVSEIEGHRIVSQVSVTKNGSPYSRRYGSKSFTTRGKRTSKRREIVQCTCVTYSMPRHTRCTQPTASTSIYHKWDVRGCEHTNWNDESKAKEQGDTEMWKKTWTIRDKYQTIDNMYMKISDHTQPLNTIILIPNVQRTQLYSSIKGLGSLGQTTLPTVSLIGHLLLHNETVWRRQNRIVSWHACISVGRAQAIIRISCSVSSTCKEDTSLPPEVPWGTWKISIKENKRVNMNNEPQRASSAKDKEITGKEWNFCESKNSQQDRR